MQLPDALIALILLWVPPSIVSAAADKRPALQWPHNLPGHLKYFPEDEVHVKRGLSIRERLKIEKPIGVKKMSEDEGEMFFLDNWIFAGDGGTQHDNAKREESLNVAMPALSPLRPLLEQNMFEAMRRFAARASLMGRDFKCPEGTNDCASIGAPDSCCGTSDTCITIPDTGFGSVGCCPRGRTCAGAISCDVKNGFSSCPDSPNGGCCLPGYSCKDVGCVAAGTSVTWVQPSTSAPRPSSTAVVVVPTTPSPAPTPTPSSSYTCSSGWFSCAASLGGGCCQNGRQCATGASCIDLASTARSTDASPSAPVRPTPESSLTSGTSPGASICPTGFYVCSAYYPSGCCRVGRDCQTTGSCVPTASATIVGTNGVVIVAPTGASLSPQRGTCATGWYSCAASVGGNCCPNGFGCGQQQCTATASGNTQVADKVAPSRASVVSNASILGLAIAALSIGIGMVVL